MKPDMAVHLVHSAARSAFDVVDEVAVDMCKLATFAMNIHAHPCTFPLNPPVGFRVLDSK